MTLLADRSIRDRSINHDIVNEKISTANTSFLDNIKLLTKTFQTQTRC